jgi:hypothetical protein
MGRTTPPHIQAFLTQHQTTHLPSQELSDAELEHIVAGKDLLRGRTSQSQRPTSDSDSPSKADRTFERQNQSADINRNSN